jgi:RND family efflux transporter MFP subunit
MPRKIIVSIVLIVLFLGTGIGIALFLIKNRPTPPMVDAARPPLVVTGLAVQPKTVTQIITGFGTARADREARISAQVAGEIVDLPEHLRPGVSVKKGQVLIRIDDREYQEIVLQAHSKLQADQSALKQLDVEEKNLDRQIETAGRELKSAEWDHEKIRQLYEVGDAPQREFKQSESRLERIRLAYQQLESQRSLFPTRREQLAASVQDSKARLEQARLNVDRCEIRAPFDGQISSLAVEIGERVMPGSPLLSVLDPSTIEIPIELPISQRDLIKIGASCRMSLESRPDVIWIGAVRRISPSASERMRTFQAYVVVSNRDQDYKLMPGSFVRADLDGPTLSDVILIPRGSVHQGRVFIHADGKAWEREVRVDRHLRDMSVVNGLNPGEFVITSNLDALFDGVRIRIRSDNQSAPTPPLSADVNAS